MEVIQKASTKRLFVDLWAHETSLLRRRIAVDCPADCTNDELEEIGGNALNDLCSFVQSDTRFEDGEHDDFCVLDDITIESGVPAHIESDLRLVRDSSGELVLDENGGQQ